MKKNHTGTIKEIKQVNKNVYSIKFSAKTLDRIAPGEYISILCNELTLRRPFSVADFEDGIITVLFKKRGKGTKYISELKAGDEIVFSAPLGNTFKLENKKTLLIGAGIGVAPLFYLKKELDKIGAKTYLAAGFASNDEIIGLNYSTIGMKSIPARGVRQALRQKMLDEFDFISTDDGSNSNKGSICDYLEKLIKEFKPEKLVSCAPHPVLKIVAETAQKHGLDCEVCMEKVMACGIGVCRGCVIKVKNCDKIVNKTVCKDGPVFDGSEVVW